MKRYYWQISGVVISLLLVTQMVLIPGLFGREPSAAVALAAETDTTVTVAANLQWTETPVSVAEGDAFSITATGTWSTSFNLTPLFGPDGMVAAGLEGDKSGFISANHAKGALIGAIAPSGRDDEYFKSLGQDHTDFFLVGSNLEVFEAYTSGKIYLGFNDYGLPSNQAETINNIGAVNAIIKILTTIPDDSASVVSPDSDSLTSSSVNTQSTAFAADIVFAIDESGSMGDDISEVKANVQFMADELSGIVDARYGLIGFGATLSHRPDAANGAAHIHTQLTDLNGFKTALNELVAGGWFEPGLSATIMGMASQMNFRAGAVPIMVLITDEDADDPWNLSAALQSLQDRNATWFGIVRLGYGNTANTYGPNAGSLAAETDGQVFSIFDFRVDPLPVLEAVFDKIKETVVTESPATTFGSPGSNPMVPFSLEPVNLSTGNYAYLHQDMYIPTRGFPLHIVRSYNSLDAFHGPFGQGWTFNYGMSLTFSLDGDAILMTEEGRRDFYELNPDGTFTPPLGIYNTLTKNPDGTYTLKRKDQSEYCFNATGTLTDIADRNGNQSTLSYDASGRLVSVTGPAGRALTFSYDAGGHIVAITDPAGRTVNYLYDIDDNLVQYTDPNGGQYTFTYDTEHRMTTLTDPVGNLVVTNTFDTAGRVISQTNALGAVTIFSYDPANRETTETDPLGRQTIYVYDEHFRELSRTDALGSTTSYTYDANGNRNSITDANGHTTGYEYDANGNIIAITDALGNITFMTYDSKNNLASKTDALGRIMTFGYDANGNLVEVTDALGGVTTFVYDVYGQLINSTDANGNTSSFACDVYGNQISMTDALGSTTALAYDIVGRLVTATDANGNIITLAYDALDRLTSMTDQLGHTTGYAYDANGNSISVTDANGYTTEYSYDALNQLVSVTDAMGGTASYIYDTVGNMVVMVDANGHTTTYEYNAVNRLVGVVDPLGHEATYQYDPVGNRIAMADAKAQVTSYTYDPLNRLTSIAYDDGTSVTYVYDAVGNRIQMTDPTGTTFYDYDLVNRLILVTFPGPETVAYSYDPVGNRVSLTYPDGDIVTYEYDAANRLGVVTDWAGRNTTYTYDAIGNVISVDYPNSASIDYCYDENNRPLEITNSGHKGVFASYAYTMDAVGNRISVTNIQDETTSYSYDSLYRLTEVAGPGSSETYSYDSMGNRLMMTGNGVTTTYVYDTGDRLLSLSSNGKATNFSYDENGNLIQKVEPGLGKSKRITSYSWDAANRLTEVSNTGPTSRFTYDGDGNRVKMVVGDDEFDYVWDVAANLPVVLAEHGTEGTKKFVYGLNLISAEGSNFLNFYHYDGLGSVIGLTEEKGQKKAEYIYGAWGNPEAPKGLLTGENSFAFTGQQYDSSTDLLYLRARYYDPVTGRFISKDPLMGHMMLVQSLNRYVYALNDPISLTDVEGEAAAFAAGALLIFILAPYVLMFFVPESPEITNPEVIELAQWLEFEQQLTITGKNAEELRNSRGSGWHILYKISASYESQTRASKIFQEEGINAVIARNTYFRAKWGVSLLPPQPNISTLPMIEGNTLLPIASPNNPSGK